MYNFRLIPAEEIGEVLPFLRMLNGAFDEETMRERLAGMFAQGYECVGVFEGSVLVGISGLWTLTKHYVGRHIEPDNVVIHPDYRGRGVGEAMMQWIEAYGRSKGCVAAELNCYVTNSGGQKFWANQGYKIIGFHYQKML
jgi:GNAT superfamily N-acetyltransferase